MSNESQSSNGASSNESTCPCKTIVYGNVISAVQHAGNKTGTSFKDIVNFVHHYVPVCTSRAQACREVKKALLYALQSGTIEENGGKFKIIGQKKKAEDDKKLRSLKCGKRPLKCEITSTARGRRQMSRGSRGRRKRSGRIRKGKKKRFCCVRKPKQLRDQEREENKKKILTQRGWLKRKLGECSKRNSMICKKKQTTKPKRKAKESNEGEEYINNGNTTPSNSSEDPERDTVDVESDHSSLFEKTTKNSNQSQKKKTHRCRLCQYYNERYSSRPVLYQKENEPETDVNRIKIRRCHQGPKKAKSFHDKTTSTDTFQLIENNCTCQEESRNKENQKDTNKTYTEFPNSELDPVGNPSQDNIDIINISDTFLD